MSPITSKYGAYCEEASSNKLPPLILTAVDPEVILLKFPTTPSTSYVEYPPELSGEESLIVNCTEFIVPEDSSISLYHIIVLFANVADLASTKVTVPEVVVPVVAEITPLSLIYKYPLVAFTTSF